MELQGIFLTKNATSENNTEEVKALYIYIG